MISNLIEICKNFIIIFFYVTVSHYGASSGYKKSLNQSQISISFTSLQHSSAISYVRLFKISSFILISISGESLKTFISVRYVGFFVI